VTDTGEIHEYDARVPQLLTFEADLEFLGEGRMVTQQRDHSYLNMHLATPDLPVSDRIPTIVRTTGMAHKTNWVTVSSKGGIASTLAVTRRPFTVKPVGGRCSAGWLGESRPGKSADLGSDFRAATSRGRGGISTSGSLGTEVQRRIEGSLAGRWRVSARLCFADSMPCLLRSAHHGG
jgi:hypothetical protein